MKYIRTVRAREPSGNERFAFMQKYQVMAYKARLDLLCNRKGQRSPGYYETADELQWPACPSDTRIRASTPSCNLVTAGMNCSGDPSNYTRVWRCIAVLRPLEIARQILVLSSVSLLCSIRCSYISALQHANKHRLRVPSFTRADLPVLSPEIHVYSDGLIGGLR